MITDQEIDAMLAVQIPGGSCARTWLICAANEKGDQIARDVVRRMMAPLIERCAVEAWLLGMRCYNDRVYDSREVGSKIAEAIRNL